MSTEVEPGSGFDRSELGNSSVCHYVLDGNPVFESPGHSVSLMPGDSIFFERDKPYRVRNRAPSRSVILSVLTGLSDAEAGAGPQPAEG